MSLSNEQKRKFKQQAHHLKPVLWVGQNGVTDAVVEEFNQLLDIHELIKVRINHERDERPAIVKDLAERANAECVQTIGLIAVFYRKTQKAEKKS